MKKLIRAIREYTVPLLLGGTALRRTHGSCLNSVFGVAFGGGVGLAAAVNRVREAKRGASHDRESGVGAEAHAGAHHPRVDGDICHGQDMLRGAVRKRIN